MAAKEASSRRSQERNCHSAGFHAVHRKDGGTSSPGELLQGVYSAGGSICEEGGTWWGVLQMRLSGQQKQL